MKNLQIKKRAAACLFMLSAILLGALESRAQTYISSTPVTAPLSAGEYYNNNSITLSTGFNFTAQPGQSLHLYITGPDCLPLSTNLTQSQNYVVTSTPRKAGYNPSGTGYTACDVAQTVQYVDGLGRPLQTVQVRGSADGTKDIVQPFAYDQFGREAKKFLPYADPNAADGSYKSNALTTGAGVYKYYNPSSTGTSGTQQTDANNNPIGLPVIPTPFSQTAFEPSPLNRVLEQGAPGDPWQLTGTQNLTATPGHTVKTVYTTNNTTAITDTANTYYVALYTVTINTDGTRTLNQGTGTNAYYGAGQLYVTVSCDENWKSGRGGSIEEYKDKEGHVVLKRTFNYTGGTLQILSTYYVYDDLGNLAFVLPPKANADNAIPDQNTLSNLCYQYRYDERNRLAAKRIPGKDWDLMVYNQLDQLVLSQDGNQRTNGPNQWTVTKYDALGRVIVTGLWNAGSLITQSTLQQSIYAGAQWDTRDQSNNTSNNPTGYVLTSYPSLTSVLTVNYYDDYTAPGIPNTFSTPAGASAMTKGLLTATQTAVLNTLGNNTPDMLWTEHYYDDLGRLTTAYSQHYLGGSLNANNYDQIANTYDFTNEVTASTRTHHAVVNGTNTSLTVTTNYVYDHMGRKTQTFESINGATPILLSQADYNDIGQLKAKHLHSTNGGSNFLQDINYTYNERGWLKTSSAQLFAMQLNYNDAANGVSAQYNGNISNQLWGVPNNLPRHYDYSYDQLNRLTAGVSDEGYTEQVTSYDLMGNINKLTRQTTPYTYNYYAGTNQLQNVNGLTGSDYTYDPNGNMKHDGRNNADLTYNLLNLPQTVTLTNGTLTYTYDATGNKLRKKSTLGSGSTEDYISGIQYKTDGTVDFIQTEEGRAINNGGSYTYEYHLSDHLGNSRISFDQNSAATARQQDDYYPFGMEISRGTLTSPKNEYLYNKKELQEELGQYDYGARFYDPVIARWTSVDPWSEEYLQWSNYNYVVNNPISNIDPDGMSSEESPVLASTYIDPTGEVIKHIDDGDNRVYFVNDPSKWDGTKNNLPTVGWEDPKKTYKPGDLYVYYYDAEKDRHDDNKWIGMAQNFRGGGKNKRDRNLRDFPIEFIRWFHKYYKEPGDPDRTREELEEIYDEWVDLGRPKADFTPIPAVRDNTRINVDPNKLSNPNIRRNITNAATTVGVGVALYYIISEGSRILFPPRNIVPIP